MGNRRRRYRCPAAPSSPGRGLPLVLASACAAFVLLSSVASGLVRPPSSAARSSVWSPRTGATALRSPPGGLSIRDARFGPLLMAGSSGSGGKRRRRKRKKADAPPSSPQEAAATTAPVVTRREEEAVGPPPPPGDAARKKSARDMASELLAQEMLMYDEVEDLTAFSPVALEDDDRIAAAAGRAGFDLNANNDETALEDIFDSREFLARKRERQMEDDERAGKPSSVVPTRNRIKRSDIKAYTKLLEMDPLADEDSSYFEEEGVDFISALLGDVEPNVGNDSDESTNKSGKRAVKRTSFLGIGSGPLQVGHFFGALSVVLMAFVEYPGFPLTNLPDPLRGALQGGEFSLNFNRLRPFLAGGMFPGRKNKKTNRDSFSPPIASPLAPSSSPTRNDPRTRHDLRRKLGPGRPRLPLGARARPEPGPLGGQDVRRRGHRVRPAHADPDAGGGGREEEAGGGDREAEEGTGEAQQVVVEGRERAVYIFVRVLYRRSEDGRRRLWGSFFSPGLLCRG